jgi:hypothetical protein
MPAARNHLDGRHLGLFLAAAILFLGTLACPAAAVTVTVKQQVPMESLSAAGDVTGVTESKVGASYTLVRTEADQVVLQDALGRYRIALAATDFVPPPPVSAPPATAPNAPPPSPLTNTPVATPPPTLAATPAAPVDHAPPAVPVSTTTAAPESQDKIDALNTALGKPIFSTASFWQEPALIIAQRLKLGLEGRTKWETSYRRYFSGDAKDPQASLLGTGAYCIALYADADDHPTSLLIAFDNDGDYQNVDYVKSDIYRLGHPLEGAHMFFPGQTLDQLNKKYADIVASFEPARQAENFLLVKNLTGLFGDPKNVAFGSDAATREDSQRWDWDDVSFLLTAQPNKYNLLRLVPIALADNNGRTERIPRDDIGKKLSEAVEHRPNGDVIITQIPMANQGPKGYCVPATWERVLRYTGVPGDMYTLSRIGSSEFGGGTRGGNIAQQLDDTLHNYGRHTEFLNIDIIDAVSLHRYIDDGVPIFWGVNPEGYAPALQRYALANRDADWDQWKTLLDQARITSDAKQPPLGPDGGHQVLITGYNPETREIAWSDPWGRDTKERWMTMQEAQRCTLGEYYIITW